MSQDGPHLSNASFRRTQHIIVDAFREESDLVEFFKTEDRPPVFSVLHLNFGVVLQFLEAGIVHDSELI